MDHLPEMLRSQPHQPSAMGAIERCIAACFDCAQTCTSCADACMAEQDPAKLIYCIRLDLDCADIATATGRIISRLTKPNRALTEAALEACIIACGACADECREHAGMHAHCRICAEACDACAEACQSLLDAMQ
jgi:hypothetical protein